MFGHKINSTERQQVLELLGRWFRATRRIDTATDAMKLTIAQQSMGMQSQVFENARQEAITVVSQVQNETDNPTFWPILADNKAGRIVLEMQVKLEESYKYQLEILRLLGIARLAFLNGRDSDAPSNKDMMKAYRSHGKVLDEMGHVAGKLARYYNISAQDYQQETRKAM